MKILKLSAAATLSVAILTACGGYSQSQPTAPITSQGTTVQIPEAGTSSQGANQQQQITQTGSRVTAEEAKAFMDHHNMSRNELGVSDMSWSAELAAVAQKYAEKLAASDCELEHSQGNSYGENLFWGMGRVYTALDGSKSWYEEKADTPYDNRTYNHYTQMIWANTTQVGAGVAKCPDGSYIVVANYNPPGNYTGQYPYER